MVLLLQRLYEVERKGMPVLPHPAEDEAAKTERQHCLLKVACDSRVSFYVMIFDT